MNMSKYMESLPVYCIFSYIICIMVFKCSASGDKQEYIVYLGALPEEQYSLSSYHLNLIKETSSRLTKDDITRTFKRSFNGFAAKLTTREREKLASMKGVISVFPSVTLHLQTTRSWDYMGFLRNAKQKNNSVNVDVIVGVIDSGIWPESESFKDDGFGPVPNQWKGVCQGGQNFTCNKKLIGARYYSSASTDKSARDEKGHGTHTASTAAGNRVNDASFYGLAKGTARGGVPSARIAAYKACHADSGCQTADVLAAFDDAIADGVNVITISIGPESAVELTSDPISIGSFHAMQKGVLTVQSAGNSGSYLATTGSVAPWILSVAASKVDRRIIDKVVLGNGKILTGAAINSFSMTKSMFPLTYGKAASSNCSESDAGACSPDCLDRNLVRGKIVLCDDPTGYFEAVKAGASGSVMRYDGADSDVTPVVPLPALSLDPQNYDVIKSYFNSTNMGQANIRRSVVIKDNAVTGPVVASFSSRGPNTIISDIMKPDISAPGVDILAGYSPIASPSDTPDDKRSVNFNVLSGTSMACPHAAGAVAYVKMLHPDWSPSAIKSAVMTTAWLMNPAKNPEGEFAYGSGHLNPRKAAHPGLVYEAFREDYIKMLCNLGFDKQKLGLISGDPNTTSSGSPTEPKDLNYPSMTAAVDADTPFTIKFNRTVTNVGAKKSNYVAKVTAARGVKITVEPNNLSFQTRHEKKSFTVTAVGKGVGTSAMLSSSLVWSDGRHSVRSPIIVHNPASPPS